MFLENSWRTAQDDECIGRDIAASNIERLPVFGPGPFYPAKEDWNLHRIRFQASLDITETTDDAIKRNIVIASLKPETETLPRCGKKDSLADLSLGWRSRMKDVCGSCSAPISRQRFIVCSGACNRSFHCECANVREADYDLLVSDELSVRVTTEDSSLHKLVQELCNKIDGLSDEVRALRNDNESLRVHLARKPQMSERRPPTCFEMFQPPPTVLHAATSWPTVSEASEHAPKRGYHQGLPPTRVARPFQNGDLRQRQPMRRGSAGADATGVLTASSDHREAAGAQCSTRAASAVVDEDGFQQVPPRRRVKIAVGSDKTSARKLVQKCSQNYLNFCQST
ncbi:hypothetical protein HPB47_019158 [Ixodes persulcatus]|uniref:Uncharacterized protein n=1 Tax=Ixodes persulcatus TaxID=34615 RepID=A0AC60QIZ0_IXOPE|nr:hypothetical protein HPB47_019158 [Ixodes persulcatus]